MSLPPRFDHGVEDSDRGVSIDDDAEVRVFKGAKPRSCGEDDDVWCAGADGGGELGDADSMDWRMGVAPRSRREGMCSSRRMTDET